MQQTARMDRRGGNRRPHFAAGPALSRIPQVFLALLLTIFGGCANPSASPTPDAPAPDTSTPTASARFDESTHSLQFGDTRSTAVLLLPKPQPRPERAPHSTLTTPLNPPTPTPPPTRHPALLWIGGFGPVDRDESFGIDTDGTPISTLARTTCESFAERGFVSLRYDKRHVRGRFAVDRARFLDVGLREFVADAATALAWLRARPEVDARRVILIGYDEGARVAVQLAHTIDPSPRGVVLLSPIVDTMAETFRQQAAHSAVPYLRRYASGSTIDPIAIGEARLDPAGVVARRIVDALLDPRAISRPRISRRFDLDGNGRLHLTDELVPAWRRLFDPPDPRLDPPNIPTILEQWPPPVPTLIVHGAHDDTVAATTVAPLRTDENAVELAILPGLGHTLGRAASPADDAHRSIEPTALQRVADWLEKLTATALTAPTAR
ncbi:MAG: dienelactone hydrolase family protein [Planctomycetota bacterium]